MTTTEARLWSKVERRGPDECWPWIACKTDRGYGRLGIGKSRVVYAHRFAWELTHGRITDGLYVCHRCDNPSCVNPAHLFLGTQRDNLCDMVAKGRENPRTRGITHCKHGHVFDAANTYYVSDGSRSCRTCARERMRIRRKGVS